MRYRRRMRYRGRRRTFRRRGYPAGRRRRGVRRLRIGYRF